LPEAETGSEEKEVSDDATGFSGKAWTPVYEAEGLYHPRCKDSHTTYFPGVSTADDSWTSEELKEIGIQNQQESRMQFVERQIEKYGRLAEFSLDLENRENYQQKQEEWKKQHPPGWRRQFMRKQIGEFNESLEDRSGFKIAKTKEEVIAFGKTYSESGIFSIDGNFKLEILNGFHEAVDNVQKRFGRKLKIRGIKRVKAGDGKYRAAGYDPLTQYVSLKDSNTKILQESAEKSFKDGWIASGDKYGVYYHEIGHAVWEDLPATAIKEIRNLYQETKHASHTKWLQMGGNRSGYRQGEIFKKELSEYAMESEKEFFSEAFSQIMSGRTRPVSRKVNVILEKYYKTHVAKELSSDIIISGARITDTFSDEADEFAKMYYHEIRSFSTDARKIADNLGKSETEIRRVKAYLFEEKSLVDPDTGETRRFDPDCAIAQSWQRLMIGKEIKPHDRTLIEHELLEMQIKRDNPNMDHAEAHKMATMKFDYRKEAAEYYGNLEKHKKDR